MPLDFPLLKALAPAALGLAVSVGIERFQKPRPVLRRPWGAWAVHIGLWCAGYGLLLFFTGRPWCSAGGTSACFLSLMLINNAKVRNLREAFVFQDHEYLLDAMRYPRLFLPFWGWQNAVITTALICFAAVALSYESAPSARFLLNGQLGVVFIMLGTAAGLLFFVSRHPLSVYFNANLDVQRIGLLAGIWAYGIAERVLPSKSSPFSRRIYPLPGSLFPHLVAIQSESFFDARTLHAGIRSDILSAFDAMRAESIGYGSLKVPAWGANTARTECAFLTGISENLLGVHRFNPYRAVLRGWSVPTLPLLLKQLGYRTVCVHPYSAYFYGRDKVFRTFGFDEFLDIRSFPGAKRDGPYIADAEVSARIALLLQQTSSPLFIFAITMENHGPLHLEQVRQADLAALYASPPPAGCDELGIYLRHLCNADRMLGDVRSTLEASRSPIALCWFGDHVPIMPSAYLRLGLPEGDVPYLWWGNQHLDLTEKSKQFGRLLVQKQNAQSCPYTAGQTLPAHALALAWLHVSGVVNANA